MEYRVVQGSVSMTDWHPDESGARQEAIDAGYGKRGRDGKLYLPAAASIVKRPRFDRSTNRLKD